MEMKSGSLDYWRDFFRTANSDIFSIIDGAIMVAASDCPQEFRLRRDRIAERLFNCRMTRCTGCERVELAVNGAEDEDFKGSERDGCELQAKESKVNSSRDDDHGDINTNQTSNYSYGEVEALTDEIEEENQIIGEVSRIKQILFRSQDETESTLFESLRRLQLMELSVHILKATEIGKAVNRLRKHGSKDIRQLARSLIDGWKEMVDEWVDATKSIAEGTPDSVTPSIVEEEEGLPSPPLDEGAFFATETMELSKFFDGMDDFGNPRSNGEFNKNRENGRKISPGSQCTTKPKQQAPSNENTLAKDRNQQLRKLEGSGRPVKPPHTGSGPAKPERPNMEQKMAKVTKPRQETDNIPAQRRPMSSQQDKLKNSEEMKLEAAKRRLHERYQQAENAKRQRTIQVMELHDLPKQGLGHRNSYVKPGSSNRHWANDRR